MYSEFISYIHSIYSTNFLSQFISTQTSHQIEPNITPIPIPDDNLSKLATIAKSTKAIPAYISLIDVAGLVKGASRGEGLGNKVRRNVLRCFFVP